MRDHITADKTVTTWTCTRCRATKAMGWQPSAWPQPTTWAKVFTIAPPKGSMSDLAESVGVLCDECRSDLRRFMLGASLEPDADYPWSFSASVQESGGGRVWLLVDRDTESYPVLGDKVRVQVVAGADA